MAENPAMMQSMLDSPMMQSMLNSLTNSPDMLRELVESNPAMREVRLSVRVASSLRFVEAVRCELGAKPCTSFTLTSVLCVCWWV
jgi:hypothetical protein